MRAILFIVAVLISQVSLAADWNGLAGKYQDPFGQPDCSKSITVYYQEANGVPQVFAYDTTSGSKKLFIMMEGKFSSAYEITHAYEVNNDFEHTFNSLVFNTKNELQSEVRIRVLSEDENKIAAFDIQLIDYISPKTVTCYFESANSL